MDSEWPDRARLFSILSIQREQKTRGEAAHTPALYSAGRSEELLLDFLCCIIAP